MTTPLTEEQLAELEALADAATPGPWGVYHDIDDWYDVWADIAIKGDTRVSGPGIYADASFIATARTAIPQLIAEVRRLKAKITWLRGSGRGCGQ